MSFVERGYYTFGLCEGKVYEGKVVYISFPGRIFNASFIRKHLEGLKAISSKREFILKAVFIPSGDQGENNVLKYLVGTVLQVPLNKSLKDTYKRICASEVEKENSEGVKIMVERSRELKISLNLRELLYSACMKRNLASIKYLAEKGIELDQALNYTSSNGNLAASKYLRGLGANADHKTLEYAIKNLPGIRWLLSLGVPVPAQVVSFTSENVFLQGVKFINGGGLSVELVDIYPAHYYQRTFYSLSTDKMRAAAYKLHKNFYIREMIKEI